MKKSALVFALTGLGIAVFSSGYGATLNSLSKEQFIRAFVNKTSTSIPIGHLSGRTLHNTFSVYFDDKGHVMGRMLMKQANEPQTDAGVYSIDKDGTAYINWKHWNGAQKICFHIFDTENTYISVGCDNVFHTAFMKDSIETGNHLI